MAWAPPSETDVANMAIDHLDDVPIASLDEESIVGLWMGRNFWRVFDEVLFAYPWSFARKRMQIARDGTAPAFGYAYRYVLPTDCVRPHPPRADGKWGNLPILHEVENGYILMDFEGPLKLIYTSRETDTSKWSPVFNRIMALTLALYAAQSITGKAGYVDKIEKLLQKAWDAVIAESLSSGTPETQNRSEIVDIRGVGMPNYGGFVRYPGSPT